MRYINKKIGEYVYLYTGKIKYVKGSIWDYRGFKNLKCFLSNGIGIKLLFLSNVSKLKTIYRMRIFLYFEMISDG